MNILLRLFLIIFLCGMYQFPHMLFSQAIVSLPQVEGEKDSLVIIPVAVDLKDYEVLCYEFEINFNPAVILPVSVQKDSTLSEKWAGPYINTGFAGKLKVASLDLPNTDSTTNAIHGSGTLVKLLIKVLGNSRDSTALNFTYFKFEADYPPVITIGGNLKVIDNGASSVMRAEDRQAPQDLSLYPNYPDPVTNATTILYQLKNIEQVMVKIYNLSGQEVLTLANDPQQSGVHSITWNGRDQYGDSVPAGLYFCYVKTAMSRQVEKITVIK